MSRRSLSNEYSSLLYQEDDPVEVFSKSAGRWLKGVVLNVEPEADRMTVEYANGAQQMKKALLMHSEDVKPMKQSSSASKRSAQRSSRRDDSDSGDETGPSPYTRGEDHPSSVTITRHGQQAGGVTFYFIEVYSGDPPKHKWQKEMRYSEVDRFKTDLAAAKGWKKHLDNFEFPPKRYGGLDEEAQSDRKRKLEVWLNNVLSLTLKKRSRTTTSDEGVQLCDEFFGPQRDRDVQPVVKPAAVAKSNGSFDREDERAYNKTMKQNKLAQKKDPELRRKAKEAKERAIKSPPSQKGDDESQSSDESSDDSDEEDWFEQVQGFVQDCCTWVQTSCGACVTKCKEYAQVEDEEDEEDEKDRRRNGSRRKR